MKFLILSNLPASLTIFRKELIVGLIDSGFRVHVAAPGLLSNKEVVDELSQIGVAVHDIPMKRTGINPAQDLYMLFVLWKLVRKIQPSCVLSYTIKPVIYGTLASWLARVPKRYALITGLGYAFTGEARGKRELIQRMVRGLYRQALKRADLVFFQNPDDEALFRKLGLVGLGMPTRVVNGSGIDTSRFDKAPLPKGPPDFLLIARLLGDKGIREYVEAAAKVREQHPEANFKLVGDIDANPDSISRQELEGWVAAGHIDYLGRLDDVRPAIADASVYVLPSYREGTPRTVLEAMAMGRPIITTDAPGCRETVVDGENGFLVPVKAVAPLVDAMQRFIDQPELVFKMGHRSREIAEDKYDVHKVIAVMLTTMGLPASAERLVQRPIGSDAQFIAFANKHQVNVRKGAKS
jgi:glycosyltransferase involved in cell wall biosynthesis